jgi:hypothetical protein
MASCTQPLRDAVRALAMPEAHAVALRVKPLDDGKQSVEKQLSLLLF